MPAMLHISGTLISAGKLLRYLSKSAGNLADYWHFTKCQQSFCGVFQKVPAISFVRFSESVLRRHKLILPLMFVRFLNRPLKRITYSER
jgi:hypothetical protein